MKKYFSLILVLVILFFSYKAKAFWPFEKQWKNDFQEGIVKVNDNGYEFIVKTKSQTVGDFLAEQKIEIKNDDYLFPEKESKIVAGMGIVIKRALPVKIEVDGKEIKLNTFSKTVEEAISEAKVTLSHLDKVEPTKRSALEKNLEIKITRINVEEIVEEESIEFETVEKEDPKLKWKKTEVKQEGENGTKNVSYRITYTNGKQSSKVKLSSEVINKPTPKIVSIGTKIEVGKVSRGAGTWYAYTGTMACASLEHPKGTWLRVTNTTNGKQVIVQVNDSGPYGKGRIIDLDKVAFQKIADLGAGVINVKVEEILE